MDQDAMAVSTSSSWKKMQCIALLGPVLVPAIHIFILEKFWSDYTLTVSREYCTCSCWDTVFKGEVVIVSFSHGLFCTAETLILEELLFFYTSLPFRFTGPYEAGVARYKHMYFNATKNTLKIWALTVVCAIVFYECTKNVIRLCLNGQLRYDVVLLFVLSVFSHYYSWSVVMIYMQMLLFTCKYYVIFKVVFRQLLER